MPLYFFFLGEASKLLRTWSPSPAPGASPSMDPCEWRGSIGIRGSVRLAAMPISCQCECALGADRSERLVAPAMATRRDMGDTLDINTFAARSPGHRPRSPPQLVVSAPCTLLGGFLGDLILGGVRFAIFRHDRLLCL